jgi:hypothetical protein
LCAPLFFCFWCFSISFGSLFLVWYLSQWGVRELSCIELPHFQTRSPHFDSNTNMESLIFIWNLSQMVWGNNLNMTVLCAF